MRQHLDTSIGGLQGITASAGQASHPHVADKDKSNVAEDRSVSDFT